MKKKVQLCFMVVSAVMAMASQGVIAKDASPRKATPMMGRYNTARRPVALCRQEAQPFRV